MFAFYYSRKRRCKGTTVDYSEWLWKVKEWKGIWKQKLQPWPPNAERQNMNIDPWEWKTKGSIGKASFGAVSQRKRNKRWSGKGLSI